MTTTYTTSGRLWKGQPGDPAIKNAWGTPLDVNMDLIDSMINGTSVIDLSGLTTFTLSVANGAPDQSREKILQFIGSPAAVCTVSLPNVPKIGWVKNSTVGGFNVVLSAGAGTSSSIPADGSVYFYATDGATNVATFSLGVLGALNVNGLLTAGPTVINGSLVTLGSAKLASLQGVNDGSDAIPGAVGEYHSANAGTVQLNNNQAQNVAAMFLTAGDWEISGNASFLPQSGVTSVNFLSAALAGGNFTAASTNMQLNGIPNNGFLQGAVGPARHSSSQSATISMTIAAGFAGNATVKAGAFVQAWRRH